MADNGPKSLMFDDDKPAVKKEGPKSLAFPDPVPVVSKPVTIVMGDRDRKSGSSTLFQNTQQDAEKIKYHIDEGKAKAATRPTSLSFDNIPPVVTKTPGKTAFATDTAYDSLIAAAMKHVRDNFQTLVTEMPSIERQIKQLIPVKMNTVSIWGSSALDQEAQLSTTIAKMIRTFAEIRGNELMEKVLELAKAVQSDGILDKIFGKTHGSALEHKPQLIVLKSQLTQLMPDYEQNIKNTSASETRLMIQFAALVAVREVTGPSNDDSLERVILDRRNILQQAAMQSKLARLQLIESQKSIAQQISRVEQLLTVTLPAFEMAMAQQRK